MMTENYVRTWSGLKLCFCKHMAILVFVRDALKEAPLATMTCYAFQSPARPNRTL